MMANILLIEDNPIHARLTIKVLTNHGHQVHHAATAIEGLRAVHDMTPDLVLLDLELPDLDGKTVANRLSRLPEMQGVAIVALTSNTSHTTQRLARAYGCHGYLTKPIDVRRFNEQVCAHLQHALAE